MQEETMHIFHYIMAHKSSNHVIA